MSSPSLRSAISHCSAQTNLTRSNHAHLRRWLDHADDPVWVKVAADSMKFNGLPTLVGGHLSYFISVALRTRHVAESAVAPHLQIKREKERRQKHNLELLELARKMEEVVKDYPRLSPTPPRPPRSGSPGGFPYTPHLEWLREQASKLRERGGGRTKK